MAGITFNFSEQSTARFDIGRVIFTGTGPGIIDDRMRFTPGNSPGKDHCDESHFKSRGDDDDDQTGRERSRSRRHRSQRRQDSRTRTHRTIKGTSRKRKATTTRSTSLSISKLKEDYQSVLGIQKPRTTPRPSQCPKMFADELNYCSRVPPTPDILKPCPSTPKFLVSCPRTPVWCHLFTND